MRIRGGGGESRRVATSFLFPVSSASEIEEDEAFQ